MPRIAGARLNLSHQVVAFRREEPVHRLLLPDRLHFPLARE